MNSSELALYLEAGFIDFNIETDERFLPKILTNNQQEQVKVLENLLFELEHCDEFFFSVAFVTNSGIACLIDTLKELENKHIKGKIWLRNIKTLRNRERCADYCSFLIWN